MSDDLIFPFQQQQTGIEKRTRIIAVKGHPLNYRYDGYGLFVLELFDLHQRLTSIAGKAVKGIDHEVVHSAVVLADEFFQLQEIGPVKVLCCISIIRKGGRDLHLVTFTPATGVRILCINGKVGLLFLGDADVSDGFFHVI
jgi:hypothetical protein